MAKDEGRKESDKDEKDDDEDVVEEFTDLRDGRDGVEVPDADDALDELSLADDDADDAEDDDGDGEDDDGDDGDDADPEADEAAQAADLKAREDDFRSRNFERKKLTLTAYAAQAQTLEVREAQAKTSKATAERILAAAPAKIKAAKEAGDTDAELAAQGEVLDARDHAKEADKVLDYVATERPALLANIKKLGWNGKSFDETDEDKAEISKVTGGKISAAAGANKPSKNSAAFLKANPWFKDPKHVKDRDILLKMDRSLRGEGILDVDDPKYFTTLVKRFNEVKPGLARDLSGKQVASGERTRGRGRGTPQGTSGLRSNDDAGEDRGKVKLTKSDLAGMRQFGMDPTNNKERAVYLTEKKALARQEARS